MKLEYMEENFYTNSKKYMPELINLISLDKENMENLIKKKHKSFYIQNNHLNQFIIIEDDINKFFKKEVIGYLSRDCIGIDLFLKGYKMLCNIYQSNAIFFFQTNEENTGLNFFWDNKECISFNISISKTDAMEDDFKETYYKELFPFLKIKVKDLLEKDIENIEDLTQKEIDLLKILLV